MPLPPVPKKFHKELTAGSTLYSVRWGDVARAGAPVVLQVSPLHHCLVCPVFNGLGNTYLLPVTHVVTPPIFTALTFLAAFLFLCKRDQEGVSLAGDSMRPSIAAEAYVKGGKYSLHVYKNPKVGSKPPRVVPFLSNCVFDNEWVRHRGGYELPPVVAAYGQLANGVDSANQMALEHRETGRFKSWTRALRAFLFRYAIVNTFTVCRLQGLIPKKKSLWDFQWDILEKFVSPGHAVHTPVLVDTRGTCKVCKGRTWFKCAHCDVHLHSYSGCFQKWHSELKV